MQGMGDRFGNSPRMAVPGGIKLKGRLKNLGGRHPEAPKRVHLGNALGRKN